MKRVFTLVVLVAGLAGCAQNGVRTYAFVRDSQTGELETELRTDIPDSLLCAIIEKSAMDMSGKDAGRIELELQNAENGYKTLVLNPDDVILSSTGYADNDSIMAASVTFFCTNSSF